MKSQEAEEDIQLQAKLFKVKVKFICIAHFMYKTIQSALKKNT